MDNFEKFYNEFCKNEEIKDSKYSYFIDELKLRELDRKIYDLIIEHCDMGFKEWSKWKDDYDMGYELFIRILKHKKFLSLLEHYKIEPINI